MNPNMDVMIALAIVAVYQQRGTVHAIAYGVSQGMTSAEVISMLETFDQFSELAKAGKLL